MRKVIIVTIALFLMAIPVKAIDTQAPEPPNSAWEYMPEETDNLWDGICELIGKVAGTLAPTVKEAIGVCASLICIQVLLSLADTLSGKTGIVLNLTSAVASTMVVLNESRSMINLAVSTAEDISEYAKLLFPVLASSLTAQGGVTTATALLSATLFLPGAMIFLLKKMIIPLTYALLALNVAGISFGDEISLSLSKEIKSFSTWLLRITVFAFTAFFSVSGIIGSGADASAVKAMKLAVSGAVPMVGGMLADASESILLSAALVKNAVGTYGLIVLSATALAPALKLLIHYFFLKMTSFVCKAFSHNGQKDLVEGFGTAMGILTGAVCALLVTVFLGIVCFMKGMT